MWFRVRPVVGNRVKIDFDTLYRIHYQRVFGTCLKLLGHRAQAEDATQEVSCGRIELSPTTTQAAIRGWALTIASNHCIDLIRRRAHQSETFADDGDSRLGATDSATDGLSSSC